MKMYIFVPNDVRNKIGSLHPAITAQKYFDIQKSLKLLTLQIITKVAKYTQQESSFWLNNRSFELSCDPRL